MLGQSGLLINSWSVSDTPSQQTRKKPEVVLRPPHNMYTHKHRSVTKQPKEAYTFVSSSFSVLRLFTYKFTDNKSLY